MTRIVKIPKEEAVLYKKFEQGETRSDDFICECHYIFLTHYKEIEPPYQEMLFCANCGLWWKIVRE
jgi:hypothetical protein